jgi:hypothetical protein
MHQLEELTNTGTVLDCHLKTEIDEYLSSCKKLYSTRSCELAQNYLASMLIYFENYGKTPSERLYMNYQLTGRPDRIRSFSGSNHFWAIVRVQVFKVPKICDFRNYLHSQSLSPNMVLTCQGFYKKTLFIFRLLLFCIRNVFNHLP